MPVSKQKTFLAKDFENRTPVQQALTDLHGRARDRNTGNAHVADLIEIIAQYGFGGTAGNAVTSSEPVTKAPSSSSAPLVPPVTGLAKPEPHPEPNVVVGTRITEPSPPAPVSEQHVSG